MADPRQPLLSDDRRAHNSEEAHPSMTSSKVNATRRETRRFLGSKTGHYAVLALVSLDVSCIFADFIVQIFRCEGKVSHRVSKDTLEALGIVSLVFSCLFMAELLASIWAFGLKFFQSWFHCFDAFVIVAGFMIDVVLKGVLEEISSLIVVLRLWRVFKIIEELSAGANEQMEGLQERLDQVEQEKADLEKQVTMLRAQSNSQV